MKIRAIKAYKITLPFKGTFSHSQKDARSVDNIVVEILTYEQELRGYGEGGPRPYVTGETQESAIRSVKSLCLHESFPWKLNDVKQIWNFIDSTSGEKNHNSALCALEMALLDILARHEGRNILHYLPKNHVTNEIRYGVTLPIAESNIVLKICDMVTEFDINEVRLKMGRDFDQNKGTLDASRQVLGSGCDLRVDVNGHWDLDLAKQHLPLLLSHGINVLEQPLMPEDPHWKELADMLRTTGLKLMADESVCSMEDLEKAIEDGYFHVINVRLSKCGGFSKSLKIIQRIREAGLDYQVGCQLGESGILSAAGRALCAISSDALYCDGSYDAFLLRENLTTEHVTFGHGGRAVPLKGPGLGIRVSLENLKRFSDTPVVIQGP
jgi:L-alanine-DL-glutamate epimerase-like enolase superfamily enzyme